MSNRRLICFLVFLGIILGWTLISPTLERLDQEYKTPNTSVSVTPVGYKALYLLLKKTQPHAEVSLWQHSMMNTPLTPPKTLWFVEPGDGLFFDGDAYGEQMKQLALQGGNLIFVLAPESLKVSDSSEQTIKTAGKKKKPPGHSCDEDDVDCIEAQEKDSIHSPELKTMLDYLNHWYGLSLAVEKLDTDNLNPVSVSSYFKTRQIHQLAYKLPKIKENAIAQKYRLTRALGPDEEPTLYALTEDSIQNGEILLVSEDGYPLIVRYPVGKGSVTVFVDSFFFHNGTLGQGDNAALAVALAEEYPHAEQLFEVYSSGFKENRDFISYLATGKGLFLLLSVTLLLVAFCLWLMRQPTRRIYQLKTSHERYFTQEVFISSLAKHYLETGQWTALYLKLTAQFQRELDQKYPGLNLEQQLARVSQSPFNDVSLDTLNAVFAMINIPTEAEFVRKSRFLLDVQRKVLRHEQRQSRAGRTSTPPALRH